MHIVIDCRYAFPHLSGIGRVAVQLSAALARLRPGTHTIETSDTGARETVSVPAGLRVSALVPIEAGLGGLGGMGLEELFDIGGGSDAGDAPGRRSGDGPGLGFVTAAGGPRDASQQWRLPRLLKALRADVFHALDAFAPLACPCAAVITIHDLIPLLCRNDDAEAGTRPALKSRFAPAWRAWQQLQCARADAVLTVSRHSRSDILRELGTDPQKLHVVHHGIPTPPPPALSPGHRPATVAVLERVGLTGKPYLLYVGRRDPYKNVAGCVKVLGLLVRRFPGLMLVLAGYPDPRFPQAEQAIAAHGLTGRVVITGHVRDAELDALYRGATALLLLSRYEGFGYPVLEAMARGVPAVCTRATSLPEVGGPAALYCPPPSLITAPPRDRSAGAGAEDEGAARAGDTATLSTAAGWVARLLEDPHFWGSVSRASLEQAARFTLQRQALETLRVYQRVVRSR